MGRHGDCEVKTTAPSFRPVRGREGEKGKEKRERGEEAVFL